MAKTKNSPLAGRGLMQSEEEWSIRNRVLSSALGDLACQFGTWEVKAGLDVGCQVGQLTDVLSERTHVEWVGVDPRIGEPERSPGDRPLLHGWGHDLEFPDASFDCVMLANVYEHVLPSLRLATLVELRRVLRPGGIVVGQIPNSRFVIESHSRLPLMGWLPLHVQKIYWRLSPVPWEHNFFVVSGRQLAKDAEAAKLEVVMVANFNYPLEVIPHSVRPLARLLRATMEHHPWAWQFVLRRPVAP